MKRILKRIHFIVSTLIFINTALGQGKPSYNQYILNNYILNPALSGIENYTDVKVSYRNQWTGIEGAPKTFYVSAQGPILKKDFNTSATSYNIPGQNPRGKEYWREYTAPEPHHGVGATITNDKTGYLSRWSIAATYAYHRPISAKTTLSGGFSAGISAMTLDQSKIQWASLNPNDPAIAYTNGILKKINPELGAGLWLYSNKYFLGLSVLNIVPGKIKFTEGEKYGTYYTPNYFLTAGYRMSIGDNFNFLPSFILQYWQPQLYGLHINGKLQYRDVIWVGGTYRYADLIAGYGAMAGVYVGNAINISYSYEVATTSKLRTYTGNTHELMVGFTLGNKWGETCPKNIW